MRKKRWQKPKLIVLVRGKPEEAVLQICKASPGPGSVGPDIAWSNCDRLPPTCNGCLGRNSS